MQNLKAHGGTFGQGLDYITKEDKAIIESQRQLINDIHNIFHPDPETERKRKVAASKKIEDGIRKDAMFYVKFYFIFLIGCVLISLCSCRSLDERNEECIENMPVEVRDHVRYFLDEGEKRGKKIALKNLKIELTTEKINHGKKKENISGQYNTLSNSIKFDISSGSWRSAPKSLVFHELGHAILKKDHSEYQYDIMYYTGLSTDGRLTLAAIDRLFY